MLNKTQPLFPKILVLFFEMMVEKPIFLVGAERSGTTLLRLMLDCHPQISWCNEFEYSVDLMPNEGGWPELTRYYEWLETHRVFQKSGFALDRSLNYPQLIDSFLEQRRDRAGKPLVGATVHRHFDRLVRIWPDARFIHLIRDGRDVARSCIGMAWAGNVWKGVERWLEAEQLWQEIAPEIPADRKVEIVYEELIQEPTVVLTRICNFIGIPYDSAMMSYPETTCYDVPDPSLVQQWRHKLSREEIQLIEARIADMLTERGYELSGLPPLKVSPLKERILELHDWLRRAQMRLQREGMMLFLEGFLARKLKVKPWQKRVKLKLNTHAESRLKQASARKWQKKLAKKSAK